MPNYFDYISESADRYDEPEFIEESVNDTFADTIADMDLHCFQESLLVAGIVIGAAALIALLIFLIKKILDGKGSSKGLKQQNKETKKAVDAFKRMGIEGFDLRPSKSAESSSSSASSGKASEPETRTNRAVNDADYEYVQSSKNKTNSGARILGGSKGINYDDYKTKRTESELSGSDKFGGNPARPIWEKPIYLIDEDNPKYLEFLQSTFEFLELGIQVFRMDENEFKSPTGKAAYKNLIGVKLKKYKKEELIKVQIGYTPLEKFEKHIEAIDKLIKDLGDKLKELKALEARYRKDTKQGPGTGGMKKEHPMSHDKAASDGFKHHTSTTDANLTTIQDANGDTARSVNALKFAVGKLHTYNYKPA